MEFAVNYSPVLADLVRAGDVMLDRFKCPGWPELLSKAREVLPVYIHFPLEIGMGQGDVMDSESHQPADLEKVALLAEETGTPYINTHFIAPTSAFPGIPVESVDAVHIRRVIDAAKRDLETMTKRFSPEKILIENIINEPGWLRACAVPEVIHLLVEEVDCGFLFDLSHARLAAENLNIDPHRYIGELPLHRLCEMHVTGIQRLEGSLLELLRDIGDPYGMMANGTATRIDHVAMVDADWAELAWALDQIAAGSWETPWVVSYEFGGVGKFWEQLSNRDNYLSQLPRMVGMIHRSFLEGQCSKLGS